MAKKQQHGPHDIDIPIWMPGSAGVTQDSAIKVLRSALPAAARPKRRKPGPRPTADWPTKVTRHLNECRLSGEPMPTPKEMVQWCINTLHHDPKLREMQKLFQKLRIR
jgi:hypothetical protein